MHNRMASYYKNAHLKPTKPKWIHEVNPIYLQGIKMSFFYAVLFSLRLNELELGHAGEPIQSLTKQVIQYCQSWLWASAFFEMLPNQSP